ncbi:zinc finger protein 12 isoform X8 [Patella vulgata]|uniref:zinc finger protein 12 isoform X8 n=1 Tax=Patella vulgata TaxID=6465 RepID=UPI00217F65AB|nr:zinc finger protein 12 isoform X8 [Patella vulgata]
MEIKQEVEGFRKEFEIFCAQFHENLIKCGKVATVMTLKQEEELTKYLLTPQDETGSSSTEIASWLENNVFCLVSNEDESHYELHIWNDTQRKVVSIENYFTVLNSMFAETGNISHDKFLKKVNEKYALIPEEVVKYFINNVTKKPKFKVTVQNKENKVYGCKVISYEYLKKRVVKKRILTEIFDKSNGKVLQSRCHEEDPLEEDVFYVEKTEKLSDITNTKFTEVSSTTYSSNQALEIKYLGKTSVAYLPPGEINNQDHLVALSNVIYSVNDFPENTGDIQLEFVIPQKQPTKVFSEIESLLSLIEKTDSGSKPTEPKTLVKTPKKNTDTKTRPNMVITPPGKLAIVANPKTRGATLKHLFNEPLISESKIPSYSELNAAAATDIVETAMEEDDDNDDDDDDDDNGHDFLENVDDLFEDSAAPEVPAQDGNEVEKEESTEVMLHVVDDNRDSKTVLSATKLIGLGKNSSNIEINTDSKNSFEDESESKSSSESKPVRQRRKDAQSGPFMCPFCEKILKNHKSLSIHRLRCSQNPEKKNIACRICCKVVKEDRLESHMECHEPREGKYQCDICSKVFLRERYVQRHKKQVHDTDGTSKQSICPICGLIFKSTASCNLHVKRHDKKEFKCDICEKTYKDKSTLQEHLNIHFDVKPYKCDHCDEYFHSSHKRSNHVYQRHVPKRFQCNVCTETFKSKRYMQAHVRIHTGELPFVCSYCNKGFRSKEILRLHTKIHKEVFDHVCPICNKGFVQRCNMIAHSKTHFKKHQQTSMNSEGDQ